MRRGSRPIQTLIGVNNEEDGGLEEDSDKSRDSRVVDHSSDIRSTPKFSGARWHSTAANVHRSIPSGLIINFLSLGFIFTIYYVNCAYAINLSF